MPTDPELPAGRELDARVAEALGLPVVWAPDPYYPPRREGRHPWLKGEAGGVQFDWAECPRYSTRIEEAWKVAEHLRARGWIVCVKAMPAGEHFLAGSGWNPAEGQKLTGRACCILHPTPRMPMGTFQIVALAETPEVAICRALLIEAERRKKADA